MPKHNRVTPFNEIIATPERGMFMGNRGILHDDQGQIKRTWQGKRWIICVLEGKGRKRFVMAPGQYTELFFLDEATALAAGHRPCADCRRERFKAFQVAWAAGNPGSGTKADEIDRQLHADRVALGRSKATFLSNLDDLPHGVFVKPTGLADAYLVHDYSLLAWTPGGYLEPIERPKGIQVQVLTLRSTLSAIRAGYAPNVHGSAPKPDRSWRIS